MRADRPGPEHAIDGVEVLLCRPLPTEPTAIGDAVLCVCGNQPHTDCYRDGHPHRRVRPRADR